MNLPFLNTAPISRGTRVLLRLDLNLPVKDGAVTDTYRLDRVAKTLEFLRERGARTLVVSHFEGKEGDSLRPVFDVFSKRFPAAFAATPEESRTLLSSAPEGSFVLLENLRRWDGEKKNDAEFARSLASLTEVYVNDAFSTSHRAHASIVGIPKLISSCAGFLFQEEVENLSRALAPAHPALIILGGAKFETKLPLIEKFLRVADHMYVCGALANDIYKARGYETGISLTSAFVPSAKLLASPKLLVPSDAVVRTSSGGREEKGADALLSGEKISDAGSDAIADLRALIEKAAFVLWNGPLGEYEAGFEAGTIAVAQALAESHATTIVGGGDSLAVISKLGLAERFSFVSTGGGAMLAFLAQGTLPGIEALSGGFMIHDS